MNNRPWSGWPSPELEAFSIRARDVMADRAAGKIADRDQYMLRLSLIAEELGIHDQVDWSTYEDENYKAPWNRRAPDMQPREVTGR